MADGVPLTVAGAGRPRPHRVPFDPRMEPSPSAVAGASTFDKTLAPRARPQRKPPFALTACSRGSTIASMRNGPRKFELTADILLRAYSIGVFPMAESREAKELFWVEPHERGVFPLDGLVVSRSLAKTVRSDRFHVVADRDFRGVMRACAERDNTWINDDILRLYGELFDGGRAHSVEVYQGGALVGGLYGVSLRGAFFGESMFHRARDASKVALVHLVARLRAGGFGLLDTQFLTEHLASLGAVAMPRQAFRLKLAESLAKEGDFGAWPVQAAMPGAQALELAQGPGTKVAKQDCGMAAG